MSNHVGQHRDLHRQPVHVLYAFVAVAALLILSCAKTWADVSDEDVLDYLEMTHGVVDGLDAIANNALAEKVSYAGVTWLEVFQALIAARRVADLLKEERYADSITEASKYASLALVAKTGAGAVFANAMAIGKLASLPIEMSLKHLAETATETAFDWQVKAYIAARSPPFALSHEDIIDARARGTEILFTDDGWLYSVGYRRSGVVKFPPQSTPAEVYDLARDLYAAEAAADDLDTARTELERDFAEVLCRLGKDPSAPICRSGEDVSCHTMTSVSQRSLAGRKDAGVPFNVFSSEQEPIIQGLCGRNSARIVVGSGSHIQMIHDRARVRRGDIWQEVRLSGNTPAATGGWFIGRAEVEVEAQEDELKQGLDVLAYVCTWTPDGWRCGCRDWICQNHGSWQRQRLQKIHRLGSGYRFLWLKRDLDPVETDWLPSGRMRSVSTQQYKRGFYPVTLEGKKVASGSRYRARFVPFPTLPFVARWEWRLSEDDFHKLNDDLKAEGYRLVLADSFTGGVFRDIVEHQAVWIRAPNDF